MEPARTFFFSICLLSILLVLLPHVAGANASTSSVSQSTSRMTSTLLTSSLSHTFPPGFTAPSRLPSDAFSHAVLPPFAMPTVTPTSTPGMVDYCRIVTEYRARCDAAAAVFSMFTGNAAGGMSGTGYNPYTMPHLSSGSGTGLSKETFSTRASTTLMPQQGSETLGRAMTGLSVNISTRTTISNHTTQLSAPSFTPTRISAPTRSTVSSSATLSLVTISTGTTRIVLTPTITVITPVSRSVIMTLYDAKGKATATATDYYPPELITHTIYPTKTSTITVITPVSKSVIVTLLNSKGVPTATATNYYPPDLITKTIYQRRGVIPSADDPASDSESDGESSDDQSED